ncbi:MAG: hypothetical protein IPI66_07620 [Chitinophagaceae bacterium]|nr:hypothetical protein [Chitinophagaceae bacterium]
MVFKTSGSAAANERLRIIGAGGTPGQLVVNNTGIFAGDVFSAYASNTTNGSTASINNSIGTFAINGYGAGNGTGVYGEVNGGATTSGTAVWGNIYGTATTASGTSEGVWGINSTNPAGTGVTAAVATGVRGEATGSAGTAFTMGVLGVNKRNDGFCFWFIWPDFFSQLHGCFWGKPGCFSITGSWCPGTGCGSRISCRGQGI